MRIGPKKVYSYHPETGEYMGETFADPSPLEPGVYHIPAYATEVEPPAKVDGKYRAFDGTEWTYKDIETTTENN